MGIIIGGGVGLVIGAPVGLVVGAPVGVAAAIVTVRYMQTAIGVSI